MSTMRIIESEDIAPYDVDETLILHDLTQHPRYRKISVTDPVDLTKKITVRVHEPMVRLLKEQHVRGSHIIVWSRGGYRWALNVIQALKLESYVHIVMSKPLKYFDDVPVEQWLKDRVYIAPGTTYKGV